MIVVDTSVWIDHLHAAVRSLSDALEQEAVLAHPLVIGELACGRITNRRTVLDLLADLPLSVIATDSEALRLIEVRRLYGKGLAYVDVHLLASALLTDGAKLWTRDRTLAAAAAQLGVGMQSR